jgi:DNA-binding transcriptional MerR regulator
MSVAKPHADRLDDLAPLERSGKSAAAFRTISEVAAELEVPAHVLRFWESKFPQIRPLKRGGGRRYYRPEDVDLLRRIRLLLYRDGYTIKGAQKLLRTPDQPHDSVPNDDAGHTPLALALPAEAPPPRPTVVPRARSVAAQQAQSHMPAAERTLFAAPEVEKPATASLDMQTRQLIMDVIADLSDIRDQLRGTH